ncbi:PIN domain-containing protein [uncultured Thiodictyon sp.]|uniref:PIN domain-containing protein n=1 Tax=uncultured Thiodictyon sp. TaxID=1846217 RepID=UPI0025F3B84E|nr:PIN domain-containing protein [uncultured Thiodictyon sp.]
MIAPYFADTNVLVYAYDLDEPVKRSRARSLMGDLGLRGDLSISTQVLKEFYSVTTRRLRRPLSADQAARAVAALADYPVVVEDVALIRRAIALSHSAAIAFWDALIVEAARRAKARILYTEDLQHGRDFDGVTVDNPFRE